MAQTPPQSRSFIGRIRKLASETAIYGVSTIVGRLVNFLLVPLYISFFAPERYGVVGLVFTALVFLNQVYQYGMEAAYLKYASGSEGRPRAARVFSTATWSLLGTGLLLSALVIFFQGPLSEVVQISREWSFLFYYAAGILTLDALAVVPFAELRLQNRPIMFATIKFANILVNVGLNIYWVVFLRKGIEVIFWSNLIASSVSLLLLVPVFARLFRFSFEKSLWRSLLAFGLPFLPSGISYALVDRVNLFFLGAMKSERVAELYSGVMDFSGLPAPGTPGADTLYSQYVVGVFNAVWKLGVFMMLVSQMFRFAWQPFFLQHAEDDDAPQLFARVFSLFTAGGLFVLLAVSFFVAEAASLPIANGAPIIPEAYHVALYLVPIALLAYLFQGWYFNFTAGGYILKKTSFFAIATFSGAVLSITLNIILVPRFGMTAAAWAAASAYGLMAAVLYAKTNSLYPIPYKWGRVGGMCLVAAGLFGAWYQIEGLQHWYWEMLLLAGFGVSVVAVGVAPLATLKRFLGRSR